MANKFVTSKFSLAVASGKFANGTTKIEHMDAGSVVSMDADEAKALIASGHVVETDEKGVPKVKVAQIAVEDDGKIKTLILKKSEAVDYAPDPVEKTIPKANEVINLGPGVDSVTKLGK